MRKPTFLLGLTVAAMINVFGAAPAAQAASEIDLDASLHHGVRYPSATGFSEYERSATQRDVDVTIRHAHGLVGKNLKVYVNHQWVGTVLVNGNGFAHRDWDTDHGQKVPFASAGDPVRVRTSNGTLVVAGVYHPEPHG